eukprot:comp13084_c0_seq2/m.8389 comp13084_c0_seq2/g.8389  ORF comp13084_c0_seq2/g.8389 comp13084_c0_seq2/m.8389 type:complete len:139 (-) comp13084_c0_seq2:28-444(-)
MQLQNPLLLKAGTEKGLPTHVPGGNCEGEDKRLIRWSKNCTISRRMAFVLGTALFWIVCCTLGSPYSWFEQYTHTYDLGTGGNTNANETVTKDQARWQRENGIAIPVEISEDEWSFLKNLTPVEVVKKQIGVFGAPPE